MSPSPGSDEPYIGSVLFFKHMILGTLLLMIIVPTCLAIFFGVYSFRLLNQIDELSSSPAIYTLSTLEENSQIDGEDLSTPLSEDDFIEDNLPDYLYPVETPSYQSLYPDMICDDPVQQISAQDPTLYLTFDDGPSAVTLDILDTLEEKDVLATFFIQGSTLTTESNREILKQAYDAGHTIGVHTYSHVYADVYSSVDAFLDDFYQVWSLIYEITGEAPTIFRFPGGSINSYNSTIHQEIISEMLRRGFVYFDWNASSDDATASFVSTEDVFTAATTSSRSYTRVILLMHDSTYKSTTAQALSDIIDWYVDAGYQIEPLTRNVKPIVYNYIY